MSIANNTTYVNTFIDYLQIAPVLVARNAGDCVALSHAASALKGRRTDRKIPFPNSKEIRRGEISKMQRVFLRFPPADFLFYLKWGWLVVRLP